MKDSKEKRADGKEKKVRQCLLGWQTLTPSEAIHYFGHWRLSDVVHKMNNEGYNIVNLNKRGPGRHAIYKRKRISV